MEGGEAEGLVVAVEFDAEGLDDEVVIFALRESGDGDGADDACACDVEWEGSAVGGVVGLGEGVLFCDGGVVVLEVEADGVGAAMEAGDDVGFAEDPAGVVGGGAGESGVEEGLMGLAEAADVDDDGVLAGDGEVVEGVAEVPCDVFKGEFRGGKAELFFLEGDGGDVVRDGHEGGAPE